MKGYQIKDKYSIFTAKLESILTAKGMSVWDVADNKIGEVGRIVGAIDYVSHCYHRPYKLP